MYFSNSVIVLLVINFLKEKDNTIPFKRLQQFLPLEKSHISQSLKVNEERNFIQKSEGKKYFTTIQITPSGIQHAQRYISFLKRLLSEPELPSKNIEEHRNLHTINNNKPLPEFKAFIDNFSTKFYSPLKNIIRVSLQEYIPKDQSSNSLIDDLTDTVLDFFHTRLTSFGKCVKKL